MSKVSRYLSLFIKFSWFALFIGLLILAGVFVFISKTQMPNTEELENPNFEYASIIYDDEIKELGRYYKFNREWVYYESLNPFIVNALISTEDERYYRHSGIDPKGTVRAFAYLGTKGGASTITQQLAKLFFTDKASSKFRRLLQKLKEWAIAIQFEKRYTKEEIIAMYLNKFEFINGAHGIQAAAQTYFGKNQDKLNVEEAAVLVGMLQNPSRFNPIRFLERSTHRRNIVLSQMVRNNHLRQSEFDEIKGIPIDISNFKRDVHYGGIAPYFRASLKGYLKEILSQKQYLKSDGTKYDIYKDGLKIYTTLNIKMQKHAEAARSKHMKTIQSRYFDLWEKKDPWTHEATDYQKKIRLDALNKKVRESERFLRMRSQFLTGVSTKIMEAFPKARLWDTDIIRMLKIEKDSKYSNELLSKDIINRGQATTYKGILDTELWGELKTQWNALNAKAKSTFNKTAKMTIYDYETGKEKSTNMTPMDSIRYHNMHMQLGSVSIDPRNGNVKSWVGGINNKYFQYDHVTSDRQVGSTFKPFLYATALYQQSMSPCQPVQDIQYTIPAGDPNFGLLDAWSPSNSRGTFSKQNVSLKEGLKKSLNSVSIWLMMQLGNPVPVRNLANEMGIDKNKIPNVPSIALGSAELNVLEMTGAYCAFANNGVFNKPIFIEKIEDKDGRVIYTAIPERRKVYPENYNYAMVDMLKYASSAIDWAVESEVGGKTGTTNDYVDGWFMGITPNLVTGTWVGGEDPWIRFLNIEQGQGGVMARPFFVEYMQRIEGDKTLSIDTEARFVVPESDPITVDCSLFNVPKAVPAALDSTDIEEIEEEFEEEF